jgi:RNA polymerase sigma-70 factor (ECF subfamily)
MGQERIAEPRHFYDKSNMKPEQRETRFRELAERNHVRWTGIARAYSQRRDRDDLMQEIMLQIWKSLDSFENRSNIDTWAYRVALNTALAWDRSARKPAGNLKTNTVEVDLIADVSGTESLEVRVLDEFLGSLSKVDRAVMLLHLDDTPPCEAATIMGMAEGTLRVRLHRIRKKFEQTYCDQEPTDDI